MSKRFDGKEEPTTVSPSKQSTPVCLTHYSILNLSYILFHQAPTVGSHIAQGDEAAAMAAMFQAQSQNWEETQEKMSQLVLPFEGFYLYCRIVSNELCLHFVVCCFTHTAHNEFIPIPEVLGSTVVESHSRLINNLTTINLFLRVMFVIVADRKVRVCHPYNFVLDDSKFLFKDIGFRTVRRIMTVNSTIAHVSRGRRAFPEVCSRQ